MTVHRIGKKKIHVKPTKRTKPKIKKAVKKKVPKKSDKKTKPQTSKSVSKLKKPKKKLRKRVYKLDVDQELLLGKQVFLYGVIDNNLVKEVIKKLLALDKLSMNSQNPTPITLWINSPGGSILSGLALVDTIQSLRSPVVTVISGHACSMAGIISICGASRVITKNSVWMAHDMSGGIGGDYATKTIDRVEFVKWAQSKIFEILRKHTKLSEKELQKARHGELWLDAEECKMKNIVDVIV